MRIRIKPAIEKEIARIIPRNGSGLKALDVGSGEGTLARTLHGMRYDIVAADLFPENFACPGIECKRIDFNQRFPFPVGGIRAS